MPDPSAPGEPGHHKPAPGHTEQAPPAADGPGAGGVSVPGLGRRRTRRREETREPGGGGHAVRWRPPSEIRRGDVMRGDITDLQLHVGVNLMWLRPGEVGGSEEYVTRLLGAVDGVNPPGLQLTLFALPGFQAAHPRLAARYPVVVAPTSGRRRSWRVMTESTWLVSEANRAGVDLMYYPGGTAPLSAPRGVLHLHDLQYLTYPQLFPRVKLRWLRYVMPRSIKRSLMVCCPSEFVKSTVVDGLGAPPDDVVVVPHPMPRMAPPAPEVRERYGIHRPFFLYPAITYPHKNHVTLLKALAQVPGADLVLTGGRGPAEHEVQSEIDRLELTDRVIRTGRVPIEDLSALYHSAVALTFPSRYEGFGNPVLEAMQIGLPVVAARAGSLPEVVGGAGLLLDPDDPDAWAETMDNLLHDGSDRSWMVAAGKARAAGFSPRSSAEVLIGVWVAAAAEQAARRKR